MSQKRSDMHHAGQMSTPERWAAREARSECSPEYPDEYQDPLEHSLLRVGEASPGIVAVRDPGCRAAESLRGVAMRLMATTATRDRSRVLAIVSPQHGDGRSFVAANLAAIFAQAGQHTLLIDADLRASAQHKLFQCDAGPGLSDLLRGPGDASVARSVDGVPGLRLITAGGRPDTGQADKAAVPAARSMSISLGSERFAALLDDLRGSTDQIVIDTAAGADYVDAEAVAARAGAALMIVRRHVTRLAAARDLADNISATGARILGTVVNRR